MTTETDLLPLPEWCQGCGESLPRDMQAYARACVSSATEALRAEVALLRIGAENERLHHSVLLGRAHERAERLAEALLRYGVHEQACLDDDVQWCTCGFQDIRDDAARAALEQETTNG